MKKKQLTKKSVYFIATRYKNEPVKVDFYTQSGEHVPFDAVERKRTKFGVQLFTSV